MKNCEHNGPGGSPSNSAWPGALARPEVRIAVFYVILASIWILGSDALLNELCGTNGQSVYLQTFKGLNFVITTGLMLYLVLRRSFGGWRGAEARRIEAINSSRERFRMLSARVETLREEERTRISREIHDELGQLLTGINMQMRLIENQLADRDDRSLNPLIDQLVEASSMIDEVIASVRRIASGLRPLTLDDLGLAAALGEEAEQFSRRTGLPCKLAIEPLPPTLSGEIETAAFRIFQECLTNIARHAKASRVEAECRVANDLLKLQVADDGIGLDPSLVAPPASLGLAGMLERAAAVGGTLEFDSPAGRGTIVRLTIPLSSPAPPPNESPDH